MPQSFPRQVSVTTSFVAFPSKDGLHQVAVLNNTGAAIDVCNMADEATFMTLKDGQSGVFRCERNSKEFGCKAAADASGVQLILD